MQNVLAFSSMPMACPQCETELDQMSGICPSCRWDESRADMSPSTPMMSNESFSDRYRDTPQHHEMAYAAAAVDETTRTRIMLIVALVGILGLFYFVADSLYLF